MTRRSCTSTTRPPRCNDGSCFGLDRDGIRDIAVHGGPVVREDADSVPGTEVSFEYSPESYTGTELEFAVDVCDSVNEVFQPTPDRKVVINLPATVEMATPNVHADSIGVDEPQPGSSGRHRAVPAPAQRPRHGGGGS